MAASKEILQQAYPIIDRLAKIRCANGAFAYYESDDIYQEVWRMCLEAIERYDPKIGPIENYLVRHVGNRTKNLKRDKYFRPGLDTATSGLARTRMNLVNALPLDYGDMSGNGRLVAAGHPSIDPCDKMVCDEMLKLIYSELPDDMVGLFEDLLGNNKIRRSSIGELREKIAEILVETDIDV